MTVIIPLFSGLQRFTSFGVFLDLDAVNETKSMHSLIIQNDFKVLQWQHKVIWNFKRVLYCNSCFSLLMWHTEVLSSATVTYPHNNPSIFRPLVGHLPKKYRQRVASIKAFTVCILKIQLPEQLIRLKNKSSHNFVGSEGMSGLPLLGKEVEASLILSTYMTTLSNHWSAGSISLFPPRYRLKMPHRPKTVTTSPTFQRTRCCFLRNKSQQKNYNQSVLVVYVYVPPGSVINHVFFPSSSFCRHNVLNRNHGNKRYDYDKICCILYENLIRIANGWEIVEWNKWT